MSEIEKCIGLLCDQYGNGNDMKIDEAISKTIKKQQWTLAEVGWVLYGSFNEKIRYRAFYWFEQSYLFDSSACAGLALCYLEGLGCSTSSKKGALLFIERQNRSDWYAYCVRDRIRNHASFTEIYFYGRELLTQPTLLGQWGLKEKHKALKVYHRSREFQTKVFCFLWCKFFYKDLNLKIAKMLWEMRKEEEEEEEEPKHKRIKF
jgi:hypothetical protein